MFTQESFDPDNYESIQDCKNARKQRAKELRQQGHKVQLWTLPNQQRGYSGLGTVRDLSCRSVFMLNIII